MPASAGPFSCRSPVALWRDDCGGARGRRLRRQDPGPGRGAPPPTAVQDHARSRRRRSKTRRSSSRRCGRCARRRFSRKSRASSRASSSSRATRVSVGTPLVQINPAKQQAAVSSTEANRAGTEADVTYWRQQTKRMESLVEAGAISKAEFDQAQNSLRTAEARLAALDAQVREGRVQLAVLPRRPRRRPARSATSPSASAIASATSTDDHDDRRRAAARGVHPGSARPLAADYASACRCSCSTPMARSIATNPITFVAPRVDDAHADGARQEPAAQCASRRARAPVRPLAHRLAQRRRD